ncbi:MAG: hypothetical protein M3Z02_08920 [Actinomycetota bacterium]|nr:hypothetical protein [Actinomycetota bacterium]
MITRTPWAGRWLAAGRRAARPDALSLTARAPDGQYFSVLADRRGVLPDVFGGWGDGVELVVQGALALVSRGLHRRLFHHSWRVSVFDDEASVRRRRALWTGEVIGEPAADAAVRRLAAAIESGSWQGPKQTGDRGRR